MSIDHNPKKFEDCGLFWPSCSFNPHRLSTRSIWLIYFQPFYQPANLNRFRSEYAPREHIIIGTTEDNGSVLAPGHVRRGGTGKTHIGVLPGVDMSILHRIIMHGSWQNCWLMKLFRWQILSDLNLWQRKLRKRFEWFLSITLVAVLRFVQIWGMAGKLKWTLSVVRW